MAEQNLGFIALESRKEIKGRFPSSLGVTQQDTYAFSTGPVQANVSISADFFRSPVRVSPGLALFRDNNTNGKLDNSDTLLRPVDNGNRFVGFTRLLSGGSYIARVNALVFSDLPYTFTIARAAPGTANPLTTPEIPLGTIDKDLTRRGSISDTNTADNYAFSLGRGDRLNIQVKELGKLSGDVNIRVVRDLDADGVVDKNEILAKGTRSSKGNVDSLSVSGRGDYLLQVCQGQGNVRYRADFDLTNSSSAA